MTEESPVSDQPRSVKLKGETLSGMGERRGTRAGSMRWFLGAGVKHVNYCNVLLTLGDG